MDLSSWNEEETIPLCGKWDFYWGKLYDYADLQKNPQPDARVFVPSFWNHCTIRGEELPGEGYATYHLRVAGARPGTSLSLRIGTILSEYDVYINDSMKASNGIVGTSKSTAVPEMGSRTVTFVTESDHFDLIFHVSNYTLGKGGMWSASYLGTEEKIGKLALMLLGKDIALLGIYASIIVCVIFLTALKKDRRILWFACLCLAIMLRVSLYDTYLIKALFPEISFNTMSLLVCISTIVLPALFVLSIFQLFEDRLSNSIIRFSVLNACVGLLMLFLLPINQRGLFTMIFCAVGTGLGFYSIQRLTLSLKRFALDTLFILLGALAAFLTSAWDVLYRSNKVFSYFDLIPIGFLILTVLWFFALGYQYEGISRDRERVIGQLNDLIEKSQILELKYLKAQIKPHFINNVLTTIISIVRIDPIRARSLLISFSKYLKSCYRIESLEDTEPLEEELTMVRAYADLQKARFEDKLRITFEVDDVNIFIPPLVLQPLVENSIMHGIKGRMGAVDVVIYVMDCGSEVRIGVRDNGGGMDEELIRELRENSYCGKGIGIYNINQRLKKIYDTSLQIDNQGPGTVDIYMIIPKGENADA